MRFDQFSPRHNAPHRMVCGYAPSTEPDMGILFALPEKRQCQYGDCETPLSRSNQGSMCYRHADQMRRNKLKQLQARLDADGNLAPLSPTSKKKSQSFELQRNGIRQLPVFRFLPPTEEEMRGVA